MISMPIRSDSSRELASPCINSKGTVCPKRDYPKCMKACLGLSKFTDFLMNQVNLMSSTMNDVHLYPINFSRNGECAR